jgi:hypothetical protein
MSEILAPELLEPVLGALRGAIEVDGGPTAEQLAVLGAVSVGCGGPPDLDPAALPPVGPDAAAAAITDPRSRRRTRELLVLLELCRHPLTDAQVEQVDVYASALGEAGPGLTAARDLLRQGATAAAADMRRFIRTATPELAEVSLQGYGADGPDPEADAALGRRLRALHDLAPETLGHQYVEFYVRNGIALPGEGPDRPNLFVGHDMCHVIAGYEPTGQGEIALGAMQLAVTDSDAHWIALLSNLAVHEAGFLATAPVVAKTGTLTRPGAVELLADAFRRGAACTGDFTTADHLALVELPIAEVRARFGVPPLDPSLRQR